MNKNRHKRHDERSGVPGADRVQVPAVTVEGIRKTYKDTVAVADISFTVNQGEVLGILGANGAGKTTAVEIVCGLRKPDKGTVRVLGIDPQKNSKKLRYVLGVQLQEARLHDSLTAEELVDLYRSFYPTARPTDEALEMVQLESKRNTRFDALSGGQQQRLSVALALIGRPQVVILDELTTGLDPAARRRIWRTMESLTDETVILVSHAMDEVERLCDRIIVIDAGRIIASGTPKDLMKQAGESTLEDAFVTLTGQPVMDEEGEDE